jgi:hypothetical protein
MSVSIIVDFGGEVCYNKGYEIQRVIIFCGGMVADGGSSSENQMIKVKYKE